tara:strand:+ start:160 stop:570 length:411 start_codon:yes stop_codon:yes gene_type:complete
MKYSLGLFLILFFSIGLSAQSLSGNWGYRINGDQITIYGDKIINKNNGGKSGTLKLAIYATRNPYNGGSISGYKLHEYRLDPLKAGYERSNISNTGWNSAPPGGRYAITIVLLEYDNGGYGIVDYVSMSGTMNVSY